MRDPKRFPISRASVITELHRVLTSRSQDYVNLLEIDQMLLIEDIMDVAATEDMSSRDAQVELVRRIGGPANIGSYVSTLVVGATKRGNQVSS